MKEKNIAAKTSDTAGKILTYFILVFLAVIIIVPVAWVFVASIKQNSEFYGSPWAMPQGVHWQNFVDAWTKARMGEYFFTSALVTAVGIGILLVVALPAAYVLSRYVFKGVKLIRTGFMAGLFINVNYIVVPIFLMLVAGDNAAKSIFGKGIFLNNPIMVSLILASTTLPFPRSAAASRKAASLPATTCRSTQSPQCARATRPAYIPGRSAPAMTRPIPITRSLSSRPITR